MGSFDRIMWASTWHDAVGMKSVQDEIAVNGMAGLSEDLLLKLNFYVWSSSASTLQL